jgi:heat shock protein HspQ
VSEQNLLIDDSGKPLRHPQIPMLFAVGEDGAYRPLFLRFPH